MNQHFLDISRGEAPDAAQARTAQIRQEHLALVRHLAGIQAKVSQEIAAQQKRAERAEAESMRLRAELLVVRTAVYWNVREIVPRRVPPNPRVRPPQVLPQSEEAQTLICQTGCAGHAHPWLDPDGDCRRLGEPCTVMRPDHRGETQKG